MRRRLPPDAFEYYFGLGIDRSHQSVADHYGVQKSSVTRVAKKEGWKDRLRERERQAREAADEKARGQMDHVIERQLKAARILQAKALEALRALPPEKAIKAANALNIAWKHELLILGEPTDRHAATVEEVTKREIHDLLERVDNEQDDDENW